MKKLCIDCERRYRIENWHKDVPDESDIFEIVHENVCEVCAKIAAQQARRNEENEFEIAKFISNLRHIHREDAWKQALLDKILPKN